MVIEPSEKKKKQPSYNPLVTDTASAQIRVNICGSFSSQGLSPIQKRISKETFKITFTLH